MSETLPPLDALLAHRGPMRLLTRIVAHADDHTVCEASARGAALFRTDDGRLPAWISLELMAQCAAVHGGLAARARGEPLRPGLLLGSRRVALHADWLPRSGLLHVRARHHRGERGLVAFDAAVSVAGRDAILAEGRLFVYVFDDENALPGGPR